MTPTSRFSASESNGLVYKTHPQFLAQNFGRKVQLIHKSLRYIHILNLMFISLQTNVMNNNNKYYLIQLLEDNRAKKYYVWQRWGRGTDRKFNHSWPEQEVFKTSWWPLEFHWLLLLHVAGCSHWSISYEVGKEMSKMYNICAEQLFCSLNLLFDSILAALAITVR